MCANVTAGDAGSEPVRDWLKELPVMERKAIGQDIKTVQFGRPLGMPLVAHLEAGIWEVRTRLSSRIARVLFVLDGDTMVLPIFKFILAVQQNVLGKREIPQGHGNT